MTRQRQGRCHSGRAAGAGLRPRMRAATQTLLRTLQGVRRARECVTATTPPSRAGDPDCGCSDAVLVGVAGRGEDRIRPSWPPRLIRRSAAFCRATLRLAVASGVLGLTPCADRQPAIGVSAGTRDNFGAGLSTLRCLCGRTASERHGGFSRHGRGPVVGAVRGDHRDPSEDSRICWAVQGPRPPGIALPARIGVQASRTRA